MQAVALKNMPTDMATQSVNLLNFDRASLQGFFKNAGDKSYRGTQMLQWIHQHGVIDFEQMTNLSKASRAELTCHAKVEFPEIISSKVSKDGTCKWLMRLQDGNCVETVFIPEAKRGTLCISSQVGCALNCRFCSTGAMGFNRNLSVAEIIGQVWLAVHKLLPNHPQLKHLGLSSQVSNVVLMGMGEPLLNYEPVVSAMNIMMDDFAYGLSKYRVTLSTSGVVPNMLALAKESDCALAVSLHAPNDELREQIMPINKKYPLKELMQACRTFFPTETKRKVTFEYTMLAGVNDSIACAKQLVKLLEHVPAKVNVIPFNPFPGAAYECSKWETIEKFRDHLLQAGVRTMIRQTRGEDIDAACGQLVGDFKDKTRRSIKHRATLKAVTA